MKRLLIAVLLASLSLGAAAGPAWAEAREVTLALQAPRDGHIGETVVLFAETLEADEASDIDVVIQAAGDPYSDAQLRAAVAAGDVDLGLVSLNRFVENLPAAAIFYLPLRFSTLEEAQRVTALGHPVREAIDATINDTGVTPLWWQSYGQIVLLSAGAPAKTPLSLTGNKVRVFGPDGAAIMSAAGAAAAYLPAPDLKNAFAERDVDYALIDLVTLERLALWEEAESLTIGGFGTIEMVAIANPDFLDSLSAEERAALTEAVAAAEQDARARVAEMETRVLTTAKEQGLMLYKLGQEELVTWVDVKQAMLNRYLESAGGPGEWMLDAWEQAVETEGGD